MKVPVKDIVIYTSVHAAIIDQLHETDKVIGVCELVIWILLPYKRVYRPEESLI